MLLCSSLDNSEQSSSRRDVGHNGTSGSAHHCRWIWDRRSAELVDCWTKTIKNSMSLRTATVHSYVVCRKIRGVSLYVFADCKVSAVTVNKKSQICVFATFVSLCGPQE